MRGHSRRNPFAGMVQALLVVIVPVEGDVHQTQRGVQAQRGMQPLVVVVAVVVVQ